jgi:hypothetical protein
MGVVSSPAQPMPGNRRKSRPPLRGQPPAPAPGKPAAGAPAPNRLIAPDARWQRFQRYVWDRNKRG